MKNCRKHSPVSSRRAMTIGIELINILFATLSYQGNIIHKNIEEDRFIAQCSIPIFLRLLKIWCTFLWCKIFYFKVWCSNKTSEPFLKIANTNLRAGIWHMKKTICFLHYRVNDLFVSILMQIAKEADFTNV